MGAVLLYEAAPLPSLRAVAPKDPGVSDRRRSYPKSAKLK